MKISIFGLGYVGVVSAVCLAKQGHTIIGVDVNSDKVDMLNSGHSPIVEKDVPELLKEAIGAGRLRASADSRDAVFLTDISLVCVGTPSRANGSLDTCYVEKVCGEIGAALKEKGPGHIVVFRSTMVPGTMKNTLLPILEKTSGKKEGKGFSAAYNPEFLRESTAVLDFFSPPKTVVGSNNTDTAQAVLKMYEGISGPKITTSAETAEMVKYVDNNFHALKITFANEIGRLCKRLGMDSHEVMDIFMQDTKLNISRAYLKPGFAFGGSCLPKDLRAVNYLAKMLDVETPLLSSIIPSNNVHIINAIKEIIALGKKKIGIAGFSFKEGTDDLRESPLVEVIETLIGKGFDLKLYDKNVSLARLMGANKEYINDRIPHIASLMVDSLDDLLKDRDVIVIGNASPEFKGLLARGEERPVIFDLVRIGDAPHGRTNYRGICW